MTSIIFWLLYGAMLSFMMFVVIPRLEAKQKAMRAKVTSAVTKSIYPDGMTKEAIAIRELQEIIDGKATAEGERLGVEQWHREHGLPVPPQAFGNTVVRPTGPSTSEFVLDPATKIEIEKLAKVIVDYAILTEMAKVTEAVGSLERRTFGRSSENTYYRPTSYSDKSGWKYETYHAYPTSYDHDHYDDLRSLHP